MASDDGKTAFPTFAAFAARHDLLPLVRFVARVARLVATPVVAGALYVLALTAWDAQGPLIRDDERVLGARTVEITAWVSVRFAGDIRRIELEVACAALALGTALGFVAGGLARAVSDRAVRLRGFAMVVVAHATLMAWAIARVPQFYESEAWARGGWRRAAERALTDELGPGVVALVGVACVALVALAPRLLGIRPLSPRRRWTRAHLVATAGALVAALLFLLPRRPSSHARHPARPNVLVLAADSFRFDRLGPRVTPHLDALAARGTRFTRAYVTLARTLPSWTTMLTGRDPRHHGLRDSFPRFDERTRPRDTIAARLRAAGYATGVVTDYGGDVFSLVDLGFERVVAPRLDFGQYIRVRGLEARHGLVPVLQSRVGRAFFPAMRETPRGADASLLAGDAVDAIRDAGDRPFFLVVFFSAPHFPYAAPSPWFRRFTDPAYDGRYKYFKEEWSSDRVPDARDVAQIRGLYDGTVASFDDAASRVLAELDAEGIADDTIVIVTADHGEELHDDGRWEGHGDHLFGDVQNHVPLVVVDPRRKTPATANDLVRDVDFAPTIAALTGVPAPDGLDGRSIAPALEGASLEPRWTFHESGLWTNSQHVVKERIVYPKFLDLMEMDDVHGDVIQLREEWVDVTTRAKHRAAFDGRWKLVDAPTNEGDRFFLFDHAADPADLHDLAEERPEELGRMKERLGEWMGEEARWAR